MNNMGNYPQKLSEAIINRAKNLNSSLIADAMKGKNTMSYDIKPVGENMNFVGTAVTVSLTPGDNLFLHQAIYNSEVGYALVVDGKGYTKSAYMGELMAFAAEAIGLEGIVIDGLVRDKTDLQKLGFPIYSRGLVPSGPSKGEQGHNNISISCGGVNVQPGDLVVGDEDGVVIAPKLEIEEILSRAEKKQSYENRRIESITKYKQDKKAGNLSSDLEPDWLKDKIEKFNS